MSLNHNQYLTFTKDSCTPNGCGDAPYEIKSFVNGASFSDRMADDNYLNITSATCTDPDSNCQDTDNQYDWSTTVSASSPDRDYKIRDYQYDRV